MNTDVSELAVQVTLDFVRFMEEFTVRITTYDEQLHVLSQRSGFIYQPDPTKNALVITAGHGCPPKGSFIETSIALNGHPLSINAGEFQILTSVLDRDIAVSVLPQETIATHLLRDGLKYDIEFQRYQGSFEPARKDELYGFAAMNDRGLFDSGQGLEAYRFRCYEVGLELIQQDDATYLFSAPGPLRDDAYYEGVSGSPIAAADRSIVSILLGRVGDELLGFNLHGNLMIFATMF